MSFSISGLPKGALRALELAGRAHVFCEGWRPGVADRLGVGYDAIRAVNPAIIYCSISGYGQTGPYVDRVGHDVNYQALAGAVAPRAAETPVDPARPDRGSRSRDRRRNAHLRGMGQAVQTGEGERIDVAMADVCAAWVGPYDTVAHRDRDTPAGGSPGYGVFRAADGGYVTLAVISEDHFWRAVCDALGLADLGALTYGERLDRIDACNAAVAGAIAGLDRDTAVAQLAAAGAPVAPALTPGELAAEPQFRARQVFVEDGDGHLRVGLPARLSAHPPRRPGPAPEAGAAPPDWG